MRTTFGAISPGGAAALPSAVEFPSQRRERVDWHKLASIDLHELSSGCSMEVLQDNLSHVTFCDAEAEFDVGTTGGQRSLLKMFRLAQLIIQYLFLSQEFIETQLQQSQEEVLQLTEKYQEVKAKLLQQVEEAKKMKITNRSMRETVKCINSYALANGIFQSLKCPLCPKAFRGQDFLQSHLWRKHPNQASSVTLPQVFQVPSTVSGPCEAPPVASETKHQELPLNNVSSPQSTHATAYSNVNDVDSFRLCEIEKKFNMMNENFMRILREMEEQKGSLEVENEKRREEVKKAWEEKKHMERSYETQLEKLSEQISQLKTVGSDKTSFDGERFVELIKKQEEEITFLQAQIQRQAKNDRVEEIRSTDAVDGLSEEIQALKRQLGEQRRSHKHSLKELQASLQKDYGAALESEKVKLREMMKDIAHKEAAVAVVSQKPPPSPKTPTIKKPPTPNRATKPSTMTQNQLEDSPTLTRTKTKIEPYLQRMDTEDSESELESDSETETSRWNQNNLKVKPLNISSSSTEGEDEDPKPNNQKEGDLKSEQSSSESCEDDKSYSEDDVSSDSINLDNLLRSNPHLWNQMREATSGVLALKLSSLGLDQSTRGIKTDVLTSCLSRLRKERRKYEEKYDHFLDLRKRLENEVRAKVDDKIDNVEDVSGIQPLSETIKSESKEKQSGMLSRMVKNVQSKVKEQSRAFSSSMSKTSESVKSGVKDIFHTNPKSNDDVKVISGTSIVSDNQGEKTEAEDDDSTTESESKDSSNAQIEIHNETSKSVSRNLFEDKPLGAGSGTRPKQGNYFDNKTYGEVEDISGSEWDSEPEYENFKKEPPPKRTDSLNTSVISANLHNSTVNSWDLDESQTIKLKKPSGQLVSNLTRSIELQLSGRKKSQLAGAVDVMSSTALPGTSPDSPGGLEYSRINQNSYGSQQNLQSVSDSSNTVGTSLWGSVDAVDVISQRQPKVITSSRKEVISSWDSDDDLNISEVKYPM
ncbi:zinc finger protein DZIP1-like [Homarus americanus]|uniref:Zinc finger protein Dzip1-like n=1 Tax=Homarus americanus TaxID=6706 RepID=A0A8J5N4K6_HOMAM|nr:zinc finger protein DZIP1-like [Homarus americanus]XP_042214555.1 zinc finger protein DZIP1-like [Homarus americanus]XP_042214556.1 zinc finger protein DZIP1-like [Homarus americanus]KAG7173180.1 Zinc finger protein Dzip1-like [Homarus americanus]